MLSVIVPARDAAATIGATLAGLAAQELDGELEVVVVDNGSLDATADLAEAAGVRVIRRVRGAGAGTARNDGVAATTAPLLAFTDADCVPTAGWAAAGLAALADADLVQGRVDPDPTAHRRLFDRTLEVTAERGFYETANLFVRRDVFDAVGGFQDFLLEGVPDQRPLGEDVRFAWAARRNGARTAFCAAALVHHAVFRGTPRTFLAEKARLVDFPALVRVVPELREHTFHRRLFLNRRTEKVDTAVVGLLAALLVRRPSPLVLALPWLADAAPRVRHRRGPVALAVLVAGDVATLVALVRGSVRHRTPLL